MKIGDWGSVVSVWGLCSGFRAEGLCLIIWVLSSLVSDFGFGFWDLGPGVQV